MLSDSEVLAAVDAEVSASNTGQGSEISEQRSDALDRYLGKPYGDEVDGRSQVLTREVMETVQWMLPSLMRIFCDADNLVIFEPVGPEDEQQAEQESELVNHVYWKLNAGYYNTLTFCLDALLTKTGVLKIWKEDPKEELEDYDYLSDQELMQLLTDQQFKREVESYEQNADGTHKVTFRTLGRRPQIRIVPVPPEEFGVRAGANTPVVDDLDFCFQRSRKSYADLLAMEFTKEQIDELPYDEYDASREKTARAGGRFEDGGSVDKSRRQYWITEAYIRLDRDEDGVVELLQVIGSGGVDGVTDILSIEPVDYVPFTAAPAGIMSHRFYGESIADLVMDLQRIKTALMRGILDNTYLANNLRTAVGNRVNLDDVMTSRPGGAVRVDTEQPDVGGHLTPLVSAPMPSTTFALVEYLDNVVKQRTGAGDDVAALEKTSLANINTGVMAMAYDAARAKIELIARTLAEIGLKPAFHKIHQLLTQCKDAALAAKLRGQWVQVDPSTWKTRADSTVAVGMGQASRERRIMFFEALHQKHTAIVQAGGMGTLIMPQHVYAGLKGWAKAWGQEDSLYFLDPAQAPPQQPQPDAQGDLMKAQAQALIMDGQSKMQRNQLEAQKMQLEARTKQVETMAKARESEIRAQMEGMKARLAVMQSQGESSGKVVDMRMQQQKQAVESSIKSMELQLEHTRAERDREVDIYKVQVDSMTKLLQMSGITANPDEAQAKEQAMTREKDDARQVFTAMLQGLEQLQGRIERMALDNDAPRDVEYDAKGLIARIGKRAVQRDGSGKVTRVG